MKVTVVYGLNELPKWVDKDGLSNNDSGAQYASYLLIEDGDYRACYSDAMEPEDCTFGRDLRWIKNELERCKLRAKLEGLKAARQRTFPGHRVLVNLGHDPSAVRAVEWLRMDIEGEIEDAERQLVALSKQPVAKETT